MLFLLSAKIGTTLKADTGPGEMFYVHCDMSKEEDIIVSVDMNS